MVATIQQEQIPAERLTLGGELRQIRTSRGFGLNEAAGRSQISKAALSQWESGARIPSGQALDRLLTTLRAEPRDRARLLTQADPAYARTALAGEPMGSMMDLGQVLRGMRVRVGFTQAETASLCSVGQSTVAAWESGDSVPGADSLQNVLRVLGARPEEIEAIRRSTYVRSTVNSPEDLAARLMELHNPLLPVELREPQIILLQRDAWRAASYSPAADEIYCEITTWRASWCRRMGLREEAVGHARQGLRLAKATGNADLTGFAIHYVSELQRLNRGIKDQRNLLSAMKKWLDLPMSAFHRGQFLCSCAETAFWARLPSEGEEFAREAIDLLGDYSLVLGTYPYNGVEGSIDLLAKCQVMNGQCEQALQTLGTIPNFEDRGYFSLPGTTNTYLLILSELGEDFPAEALPAVRNSLGTTAQVDNVYWKEWERYLLRHRQYSNVDGPWVWPLCWESHW